MRGRAATILLALILSTVGGAAFPLTAPSPDPATVLATGGAVTVTLDGVPHALTAEPRSILADGVRPRAVPSNAPLDAPDLDAYAGEVAGLQGATVRLIVDEDVEGLVLDGDGSGWWLTSTRGRLEATPLDEMPRPEGAPDLAGDASAGSGGAPAGPGRLGPAPSVEPLLELELALEADHTFYSWNEESWSEKMVEAFHLVDGLYRSNLGVGIEVTWIGAWEEPDPYTAIPLCGWDGKLRQFRDHWEANRGEVERHNAYLTIGSPRGSGCAYVRDVNTSWAYAVSEWGAPGSVPRSFTYWRLMLQAHELGHNFDGRHERSIGGCGQGTIMAECYGATAPTFSPRGPEGGEGNLLPMRAYAEQRLGPAT